MSLHTTILEQGKNVLDNGFKEIENEFDDLQLEIQNANDRNAQLGAVQRLANKIECTEDCFMSDDQAAAILDGLSQNRQNIESIVSDVGGGSSSSEEIQRQLFSSKMKR